MNDLRFAIRQLRRQPAFALLAALTLALGIGPTVAIFGIVNELLFIPRAVSHPDELAAIGFRSEDGSLTMVNISRPFYEFFHGEQRAFSDLIGFAAINPKLETSEGDARVRAELVSGSYFQMLGVKPVLGRTLLPADDEKPGEGAVAVISHKFWKRNFQSDPNVIGQSVRLDSHSVLIVGVAAEKFAGLDTWSADMWLPTTLESVFKKHTVYRLVGRLGPGVTRAQAQADTQRIYQSLSQTYGKAAPPGYERYGIVSPDSKAVLLSAGRGSTSPFYDKDAIWRSFFLFMGASALVLLVSCSNFASLLLVRALRRRKETATRLALGAFPRHIVRQSVLEGMLLACLGGILGVLLAFWLNKLLVLWKPAYVRFMAEVSPDWRVLAFCALTALGTGFLFGLVPALQSMRFEVFPALKGDAGLDTGHRRRFHFKHWLVAGQLALSLVLLIGAGLCLRSFVGLLGVDPGFDTRRTIVAAVNLEQAGYTPENAPAAISDIIERVRTLPGVATVTFSSDHPLSGTRASHGLSTLEGYEPRAGEVIQFDSAEVGPGFFHTIGMPLLRGAELSLRDLGSDERKALVNESFVRRYWPDQEAIGRRVSGLEVIGVVRDSRVFDLTEEPAALVFRQSARLDGLYTHLLIRTEGDANLALSSVATTLRSLNSRFSSATPRTMREVVLNSLGSQRYTMALISGFALTALILAGVGVYGVMSYLVSLMNREFGIRISVGAQKKDIIRLVLGFGLKVIVLGMLLGLPCAAIATRFLRSELYEVHPLNPTVLLGTSVLLSLAALAACWLPARRAANTEPMEALRAE